jgi:hypothetical protein
MRSYGLVSGFVFAIVALAQLTRALLGWPVRVDGFFVPIWVSVVAFVITASLSVWGIRAAGTYFSIDER